MMMKEIRNCILNKEYSRVNEIKNIINNNEINLRKKKHEKKLEKLIDLEAQLTKSSGNYIIQNNDDKDFILANIDPYKGYEIVDSSLYGFERRAITDSIAELAIQEQMLEELIGRNIDKVKEPKKLRIIRKET